MTLRQQVSGMVTALIRALQRPAHEPDTKAEPSEYDRGSALTRGEDHEPIRVPIAGVAHQNRYRTVQRLLVGEIVLLRRDPTNDFDPNAISVETRAGEQLGYIGRNVATKLGPYMDTCPGPLKAVVTELTTDISTRVVGAAVSFYLPPGLAAEILGQAPGWEFYCDPVADGATYLMLNCDEVELTRVNEALRQNGFHSSRSGLSYGTASNGRQYRWYVRLEAGLGTDILGQLLSDTLGSVRRHIDANKWIAEFDDENLRLRSENSNLRNENTNLKSRTLELERALNSSVRHRRPSRRHELDAIIDTLVSGIVLIRDSLDVMERELESCGPVLRELRTLCWEPSAVRGERVQSAPEWRETHFSTGQQDDGRLYFRHRDGTWMALVSFKQCQQRDVEYLKRR